MKNLILIALLALFIISTAHAAEYYADVILDISQDGSTIISGTTNHPKLDARTTAEFTSMQKGNWTFEIDLNETFSAYLFEIILPPKAQTTDIKISGEYRITTRDSRILIIASGEGQPLTAKIKYTNQTENLQPNYIQIAAAIIIFIVIIFFANKRINNKDKKTLAQKTETKKAHINKEALTERQVLIFEYLEKKGKSATQKEIETALHIPKASLSRNLAALERKELIKKEAKGMTMVISINQEK